MLCSVPVPVVISQGAIQVANVHPNQSTPYTSWIPPEHCLPSRQTMPEAWDTGGKSVAFIGKPNPEFRTAVNAPFWVVQWWRRWHERLPDILPWKKVGDFLAGVTSENPRLSQQLDEAWKCIVHLKPGNSLFTGLNAFGFDTSILLDILGEHALLTSSAIHLLLLSARERHTHGSAVSIVNEKFGSEIVGIAKTRTSSTETSSIAPRPTTTAVRKKSVTWLRLDKSHWILGILHVNGNHWACICIRDAQIFISDSTFEEDSPGKLPDW